MAFSDPRLRLLDGAFIVGGVGLTTLACFATLDTRFSLIVWIPLSAFYFLFYRRLAYVIYWSWSTMRLVRRNASAIQSRPCSTAADAELPFFHILIASYGAGASIGPVLAAIDKLDYPKSRYTAWIITEQSEQKRRDRIVANAPQKLSGLSSPIAIPDDIFPHVWQCVAPPEIPLTAWVKHLTAGDLSTLLSHRLAPILLVGDLFGRLLAPEGGTFDSRLAQLGPLPLTPRDTARLAAHVLHIQDQLQRVAGDLAKLLGTSGLFRDDYLRQQLVAIAIRSRFARKLGRRLCRTLERPAAGLPPIDVARFVEVLKTCLPTTQEEVARSLAAFPETAFRHLDPTDRGFKPGALNIAWRTMNNEGLLQQPEQVFFLIIDSDSLLPRHVLNFAAREIQAGPRHIIRQLCSIPTANFPISGIYSQFVAFADAIGAIGKWARSTRRQLKPDLHAGSGVFVPATLASWIAENVGTPWDASSLTEDARMIVSQFGMTDGVRTKTGFVPTYLLEAVPAEDGFLETYKAYWKQRRRWTTGGFDEAFYMARAPRWVISSRYHEAHGWTTRDLSTSRRLVLLFRRIWRIGVWLWDHFLWGLGGFFIFTHWWVVSCTIASPGATLSIAGLVLLFISPLVVLAVPARELVWFVPGGIGIRKKVLLYILCFVAIWIYVLPIVVTQVACCLGLRTKILEWNPTRKPRY